MEISLTQYKALIELVNECRGTQQSPSPAWIDKIKTAFALHPDWPPPPPFDEVPAPAKSSPKPPGSSTPPRAAVVTNKGERPGIAVDENMERVARQTLEWWGTRFCVFQLGGRLLEIRTDPGQQIKYITREVESPRTVPIGSARARALASRECRYTRDKIGKDGNKIPDEMIPPDWLGSTIVTRTDFPGIPVLSALVQSPTLRRDGALIWEPGYDESTGIYLTENLKLSIPDNPTLDDARKATALLLDLLCDFEFPNPASKSVWLAGLLSVACRHTFKGPTPIFIFDASKRGAGKTRLADMISYITTGRSSPKMVYVANDIEMDKRITSLGLAGDQLVLIDNIVGRLASPSLDMVLTSETYTGRILNKSEMTTSMPMKMVWFATGNSMVIGADTARRALLARIEPSVDHPEHRSGPRPGVKWKYRLPDYCQDHRAELLSYALTIVSAYIRAGRPKISLSSDTGSLEMGSYEGWSDTIRSAIVWAGALDPCDTIKDVQSADLEDIALRTMVECWPAGDGVIVTTAALIQQAEPGGDPARIQWRNALLEWLPAKPGNLLPTPRELGYALRNVKGAIIGNYKIVAEKHTINGIPWKRVFVGEKSEKSQQNTPTGLISI